MRAHKAIRAAELLMQNCNEGGCEGAGEPCVFWDDDLLQCSLMNVRSPGHFPMEEIRERIRRRAQERPAETRTAASDLPRRSRLDMVAERFVLED